MTLTLRMLHVIFPTKQNGNEKNHIKDVKSFADGKERNLLSCKDIKKVQNKFT